MTEEHASTWIANTYKLTAALSLIGLVSYLFVNWRSSLAFALGCSISFGNFWVFERLSFAIAPGVESRKPWTAGVYAIRYILLLGIGYVIVKIQGADPLAVILGLFANPAAVLAYLIFELAGSLLGTRRTR